MYYNEDEVRKRIQSGDREKVSEVLDGSDHESGHLESLDETQLRIRQTLSRLILLLVHKGAISEDEAVDLLFEYSDNKFGLQADGEINGEREVPKSWDLALGPKTKGD